MRLRSLLVALILVALAIALAYHRWLPAPSDAMAAVLGIRERLPVDNRYCGYFVREVAGVTIPTGEMRCVWARRPDSTRRAEYDQIFFRIVGREILRAERSWNSLGRENLEASRDSARRALRAHGGETVACRYSTRADHAVFTEYWRFPGFHVTLYAGTSRPPPRSGAGAAAWGVVALSAERETPAGC